MQWRFSLKSSVMGQKQAHLDTWGTQRTLTSMAIGDFLKIISIYFYSKPFNSWFLWINLDRIHLFKKFWEPWNRMCLWSCRPCLSNASQKKVFTSQSVSWRQEKWAELPWVWVFYSWLIVGVLGISVNVLMISESLKDDEFGNMKDTLVSSSAEERWNALHSWWPHCSEPKWIGIKLT